MCLEEMYKTAISAGAVFFISAHRRFEVNFDESLRRQVCETAAKLRKIRRELLIPPAEYGPKCRRCSMRDSCMPMVGASAKTYCEQLRCEAERAETE